MITHSLMPRCRNLLLGALTAAIVFAVLPAARASEGLMTIGTDALQLGRADAGTASPRSAYWILMNPASIVDLERRVDASWVSIWEHVELQPRGLLGNSLDGSLNADGKPQLPGGGLIYPIDGGDKGTLGVGLYVIGGGEIDYERSRTILGRVLYGNRDRRFALQHVQLASAYGYEFDNGWALGGGIQTSLTRLRTDSLTLALVPVEADYEWDEVLGIGFNLGIYKAWDKFSFGALYKSRQWSDKFDEYADLLDDSIDYPHQFRIGAAYRPIDNLEFVVDYEYQMWSKTTPFGEDLFEDGLHWDDIHAYKIGVEWRPIDRLALMAGFSYSSTVIDDDHVFISVFVPTIVEQHYSFGVSFDINEHHSVHATYTRSAENDLTDSGNGDLISRFTGGSESTVSGDTLGLGYTWKF